MSTNRSDVTSAVGVYDPGTSHAYYGDINVRQGYYGGKWYAWTKWSGTSMLQGYESLIWLYSGNGSLYECHDYNGTYTSGVPSTSASKVQAKWSGGWTVYGPAVYW